MAAAWNSPKSLERISARTIVKKFLQTTKTCMKNYRLNHKSSNISDREFSTFQHLVIPSINSWWRSIPGAFRGPRSALQEFLDELTEVNPNLKLSYSERLLFFFMKILLLDEVFIDRDYEVSDICLIPAVLEVTVVDLIKTACKEMFPMRILSLYGPIFPDITEAVLSNAPGVEVLAVSHKNITNDVMVCIGNCCPKLRQLQFIHYNISTSLSVDAFTKGLFKNATKEAMCKWYTSGEYVPVSFPNLQALECGMSLSSFDIPLSKWLLFYYDSLSSLCVDWRANVYESDSSQITQDVIIPVITSKNKVLALREMFLNYSILTSLNNYKVNHLVRSVPMIEKIFVDCNIYRSSESDCLVAGSFLKALAIKYKLLNSLSISNRRDLTTLKLVCPMLSSVGSNLLCLTIDCENQAHQFLLSTLEKLLSHCCSLIKLKLLFPTRYAINYKPISDETFVLPRNNLKELWMHEVSPWEAQNVELYEIDTLHWLKLLNILQHSAPRLQILSTTTCDSMSIVFDKLSSEVSIFHLHVKDGCESLISFEDIIRMTKRFKNLRTLYLEELEGDIFWRLKDYFTNHDLQINWGNLDGWPRT